MMILALMSGPTGVGKVVNGRQSSATVGQVIVDVDGIVDSHWPYHDFGPCASSSSGLWLQD
jgi:predicted ABC-type ATPase